MDNRFGMSLLLLSFLPLVLSSSQNNHTTASYQISRKPCQVKGKEGTCMFVWECVKTEGTPLGMCMERFMFGSCCSHDVDNDVVPKQSTTASSLSATVSTSTESWLTVPTLTAIITSRPPTLSSTTTVIPVTSDQTYGTNKEELPTVDYNASMTSSTTTSTTSPTHSTMTSSTTTSRIPSAGSPATLGPIKLRPKPYRRTTTRRAAIPTTTTNYPASSTEALNGTASALIAPPLTDAPNLLMSDAIVALTVPITTESNSATLTSPFDITNTLTYFNELNTTDEMPDTIPTATNQPFYDDVTTGVTSMMEDVSTITETTATESSTEQMTTVTSTVTTSLTTSESAVHNVTTTIQPSLKPILIVTLTNNKTNSTSSNPETTKKPVMAVTSLPSSYPNVECGVPPLLNRHQEGRIVGGSNSKFGSWPWQVSVRRTSFFGFSSTHRCGGALLNELWVITAGHCVEDLLVSQIRLRMGEFDFSSVQEPYPFVERGVNKKIVHPKYNFFTYEYDLALVRLEEPITFQPNIAPICLPAMDESLIGQNGTVTGWGRLSEGGTLPSMLQQVTVPIVSNDKCKDMFLKAGRHEYIPEIFMCAGFEEGGRDSCQGDSGGPLQIRGRDGRYFLAGIISWGIGCAEANLPGVCTRISKFTSWILENVT